MIDIQTDLNEPRHIKYICLGGSPKNLSITETPIGWVVCVDDIDRCDCDSMVVFVGDFNMAVTVFLKEISFSDSNFNIFKIHQDILQFITDVIIMDCQPHI